jgi:hypothetical protein
MHQAHLVQALLEQSIMVHMVVVMASWYEHVRYMLRVVVTIPNCMRIKVVGGPKKQVYFDPL